MAKLAKRPPAPIASKRPAETTIERMIMKALEMDKPELIDKFVEIYQQQEAERKKTAYVDAMARAQAKIQPIANNALNTHTNSRYAKLAAINKEIAPIYGAEGLSVSFKMGEASRPDLQRIIAEVSHEAGHTDDNYWIELPLDDKGAAGNTNKTRLHAIGSTTSYGRRYLVCMIFNVATEDDDDGQSGGGKISPQKAREEKARQGQAGGQKSGSVPPPRSKPTATADGSEPLPVAERPQLLPANEAEGEKGIDKARAAGYTKAITRAFNGYGEKAFDIGWAEFKKRFPQIERMGQIRDNAADQKVVLNWIANPQEN